MKTRRTRREKGGMLGAVIRSVLFSAVLFFAVMLVISVIIDRTEDPGRLIGALGIVGLLVSAALSGFITTRLTKEGGAAVCAASALIFALMLLLTGIILSSGAPGIRCPLNCLCYLGVSLLGGLLASRIGKGRRRR